MPSCVKDECQKMKAMLKIDVIYSLFANLRESVSMLNFAKITVYAFILRA